MHAFGEVRVVRVSFGIIVTTRTKEPGSGGQTFWFAQAIFRLPIEIISRDRKEHFAASVWIQSFEFEPRSAQVHVRGKVVNECILLEAGDRVESRVRLSRRDIEIEVNRHSSFKSHLRRFFEKIE